VSRIIDADNTVKTICGYYCGCERDECCSDDPCEAVAFIEAAPTISPDDVRGVGEWIVDSVASNVFRCSICGSDAPVCPTGGNEYKSRYCPNCGARMEVSDDA